MCALVVQEADALELVTVDGLGVVVETAEAQAVFTQMRQVRKRRFFAPFFIKMIILPRQARDKHRENSKKDGVFP